MGRRKGNKIQTANATTQAVNALKLYIGGCTFRQIADKLECSVSTAHGYVKTALQEAAAQRADLAEAELEAQVERLQDAMRRVAASKAYQQGNPQSVTAYIKACESLRKLLGLDQPSKVEVDARHSVYDVTIPGVTDEE
jgi:DNA-binding CsgD family transcriptional regulator